MPKDLEWHQELRVCTNHQGHNGNEPWLFAGSAVLRGVGFVDYSIGRVIAPLNHEHTYKDQHARLTDFTPFNDPGFRTWSVIFHASCWDILLQRVPKGLPDIAKFSNLVFQALFCTTWGRYRYIRPGHDFGGASQFRSPVGNPIQRMTDQGSRWLLGSPAQFRDVPEMLSSLPKASQLFTEQPANMLTQRPLLPDDIFSSLPAEILYPILSILSSPDIQHLRFASRYMAAMINPVSLPQSFWRSRFYADFEMGFASPVQLASSHDWREAYFALKRALNDISDSGSDSDSDVSRVKNRRRIWNLAGANAALLTQFMMGWTSRATLGECVIRKIRVWTVMFNSQEFISGLQFRLASYSDQTVTDRSLVFISPRPNQVVEIPSSSRISALELALCFRGVTGVRIIVEGAEHCGLETRLVGDVGNRTADIGFGKLTFDRGNAQQLQVVAALDAFKIIALGVSEPGGLNPESARGGSHRSGCGRPLTREKRYPCPVIPTPIRWFTPSLNMDFGGPGGQRLVHLTRTVTHLLDDSSPIDTGTACGRLSISVAAHLVSPLGSNLITLRLEPL
ncbi:hypothetical protein BJY01DRAFT_262145 [Aspergillus pseudoustus]|uniref:F-box domain-containing protein n=1 Tax=Aspergillus pseudoustus TaxID=1810923 RepID=A0ABR4IH77_9EURO